MFGNGEICAGFGAGRTAKVVCLPLEYQQCQLEA